MNKNKNKNKRRTTYREAKVVSNGEVEVLLFKTGNHLLASGMGVGRDLEDTVDVGDADNDGEVGVLVVAQTSAKAVSVCCWVCWEGLCAIIHYPVYDRVVSLFEGEEKGSCQSCCPCSID